MLDEEQRNHDLAGSLPKFMLTWGAPIGTMLGSILLPPPIKTIVWIAALLWMGAACLLNAKRCGRTHCRYTGPFFIAMSAPVGLHGFDIFSFGPDGWRWLGISVAVGGGGIWWATEKFLGKYKA